MEEADSTKILKKLRGSIEFKPGEKGKLLAKIKVRRAERRL
jgi:hypothetical protein